MWGFLCRLITVKTTELHNRTQIESFCSEESARLGHVVLLLPVSDPLIVPERMPEGFTRKDREGNLVTTGRLVAFDPSFGFDAAGGLSLSFNDNEGRVGIHLTELPGNYVTDVMSKRPDDVDGVGHVMVVDGYGWRAENHDTLLTNGARFVHATGEISLLGIGTVCREDLGVDIRYASDPAMEHYQRSTPIGM
jgi:hypothetical protein